MKKYEGENFVFILVQLDLFLSNLNISLSNAAASS